MPEPDAAEGDRGGFVPIAIVYSLPEAMVLVATLRAYGILAIAPNYGHVSAMPPILVALGGLGVAVAPQQIEDALALLGEIDGGWRRPAPAFAESAAVNAFFSLAMWVAGAPPPPRVRGSYAWRRTSYSAR